MKSFAQYLVETRQTFDYRIKILGDADAELINKLEEKLQQFDVVKMTEPKISAELRQKNGVNESVIKSLQMTQL